jgi:DNA-binding CsgD family transcriptional regulator
MEQLWLFFSVVSVATGFGLLVAVVFMQRLAPMVTPPPVLVILAAVLLMGLASVGGVYLRVLGVERSVLGYRVLNAAAWGLAAFAGLHYLVTELRGGAWLRRLAPPALGVIVLVSAFLAAHPPATALLGGAATISPTVATAIMLAVEVVVGAAVIAVGVLALRRSRRTKSRPWRALLRGIGIALLILIPANLLDFAVSVAVRSAGGNMRDGFVFAAGYGVANITLIVAIIRGVRLSVAGGDVPAVPQQWVDVYGITRREREIVDKVLHGMSDRQIAEELYISPRTVDTHLRSIFRKCGVGSRMQLSRQIGGYGG